MKVIKATYSIERPAELNAYSAFAVRRAIAEAARTCYQSQKIGGEEELIKNLVMRGHEAMLEFATMTVRFVCDRGVGNEIVRHRIASFAQESTRCCNYSKGAFGSELSFADLMRGIELDPVCSKLAADTINAIYCEWLEACEDAERHYIRMIELGASPQIARSVLSDSTKTELVITTNMREWRHFFALRAVGTTGRPHPQMLEVACPLLREVGTWMPELFGDLLRMMEGAERAPKAREEVHP